MALGGVDTGSINAYDVTTVAGSIKYNGLTPRTWACNVKQDEKCHTLRPKEVALLVLYCNYIYSPSCFGQKTAKGPFGLRVKVPPAQVPICLA